MPFCKIVQKLCHRDGRSVTQSATKNSSVYLCDPLCISVALPYVLSLKK
jgi:hypothetical protein